MKSRAVQEQAKRSRPAADKKDGKKKAKLSRLVKPESMSLEDWQVELRRQFGRDQKFRLRNVGGEPVFSEFEITNPQSRNTYRVRIRGSAVGMNACTCPDFATNTLGTCKHIEYVLGRLERKSGAVTRLRQGCLPEATEIYLRYGARREVHVRPGREASPELLRLIARYATADNIIRPESFDTFDRFLAEASQLDPDLRCDDDVLAYVAEVRDAARREEAVQDAFPQGIASPAFKDLLKVELYDYQKEAALFAARAGRILLGDEMGLGKTIQALATAEVMARLYGVERVLIVCPTSLKYQWQREIERCTDRAVGVIGGHRGLRSAGYRADSFYKIANYDTVYRDLDLIDAWGPDLVILDEAQRIKNWSTRTARSVKKIASPYALVLTGTPLENRLEELISIVQFVDRFRLGPTFRLLHEHQVRDEVGKVVGYQKLDQIGQTLSPILLRRHKDEVLDQLPERIDTHVFVPMHDLQRKIHDENREIVARIVHKWRKYKFLSEADKRRLMAALQRMRMSCDSSYLIDPATDEGRKADEALTLLGELFERPQTKAVIFSQWLGMHELIQRRFEGRPWEHVFFHGGVSSQKRRDLVDRFREDPNCRAFLATDAGGVGLNLQHANVVLNMDLPWNPAVLEQRIGRVHRLGQRQPVQVVHFVAQGTIEHGMMEVLKFKKSLFAGVLDGGEKDVFMGGSRLTKFMETVESATGAIPSAMPAEPEEAEPEAPAPAARRGRKAGAAAAAAAEMEGEEEAPAAAAAAAPAPVDPWAGLLQSGMAILQQLAAARQPAGPAQPGGSAGPASSLITRDEATGQAYLKMPLPSPEVIEQALQAFGALLQGLRGS